VAASRDKFPLSSVTIDGVNRNYILRLPTGISTFSNSTVRYPLIIGLHGGFGNARQFERDNGFEALQAKYNFIGVYPYGYDPNGRLSLLAWNSGHLDTAAYRAGINDARFIDNLVGQIMDKYPVDLTKVWCVGHSNGAMMCYRLAGEYAGRLTGIVPVAGTIGGQFNSQSPEIIIPTPSKRLGLIHIHGELDVNVQFNGGLSTGPGSQIQGGRIDIAVNRSVSLFENLNNCTSFSQITSPNDWIRYNQYECGAQRSTRLMMLPRRAHMWSDINAEIVGEGWASSLAEFIWSALLSIRE